MKTKLAIDIIDNDKLNFGFFQYASNACSPIGKNDAKINKIFFKTRVFLSILICASIFIIFYVFPQVAIARPSTNAYCVKGGCHNTADTDAAQYVGRDGVTIANNTGSGSLFISDDLPSGAGRPFELDWYATNSTLISSNYGAGITLVVPTGWTVAAGTSADPGWAAWSNTWDVTDGVTAGWSQTATQTGVPANYVGYQVDFDWTSSGDGSNWEHNEASDDANDGHNGDAGGTNLDGTSEKMGTDGTITIPNTASGTYSTLYAENIGHHGSNKRSYKRTTVTVNIVNITSLITSGGGSYDDTISVTLQGQNTSSNNLSNSTIDYVIFIDSNSNGEPDSGETYILSGGGGSGSWSSGLYTKRTTGFNVNASSTNTDNWNVSNTNFPEKTTYTIYAKWMESNTATIDTANNTFYSVTALGWFLATVAGAFFVFILVKNKVLHFNRAKV